MSDDRCVVCGKGESETFVAGKENDGSPCVGGRSVSHLACVLKLEAEIEEDRADMASERRINGLIIEKLSLDNERMEAENERLDKLGPISRRQWMQAMDDLSVLKANLAALEDELRAMKAAPAKPVEPENIGQRGRL